MLGVCLTLAASGPCRAQQCVGDCNGDGTVEINELVTAVNINLGSGLFSTCPALACGCGAQGICCVIAAVNNALNGCNQPILPHLALNVQTNDLPDQHQVDIVATLDHLGGPPVFYVEGCTAQCYPQFLRPITFDVVGPSGPVIIDNCGPPTYCAEGFVPFSPGGSLQQVLSVTGSVFEQGCNASDPFNACTRTDLAPGHYTATARFSYSSTPDFGAPQYGTSETVGFDWPPTASMSPTTPQPPPLPSLTPTASLASVIPTPTPTGVCGPLCDGRPCGEFTCPGYEELPTTRFCDVTYLGTGCQCSPIECPTAPPTPPAPSPTPTSTVDCNLAENVGGCCGFGWYEALLSVEAIRV